MKDQEAIKHYKVIIVGQASVGKTSLLLQYIDKEFDSQKPTIGIDYRLKRCEYRNEAFNLELWDSAGQQRYRTIIYNYFKLSKAACIVFDLTQQSTFVAINTWLEELQLHCGEIPIAIVGNKSDILENEQELEEKIAELNPTVSMWKQKYKNIGFFTTSALSGENVQTVFNFLIKQLMINERITHQSRNTMNQSLKLSKRSITGQRHRRNCCK